jgi:hypothetical protein
MFMKAIQTCVLLALNFTAFALGQNYDSRLIPPPHTFSWDDTYERVEMYENAILQVNGGFINYLQLQDNASGAITSGLVDLIFAEGFASLNIFQVNSGYIRAAQNAKIDVYGAVQTSYGQVQADDHSRVRLYGGNFGRAYTWFTAGRIEVLGPALIDSLAASTGGIVLQRNGSVGEFGSAGGVAGFDKGTITDRIYGHSRGTIVIAGALPPTQVRLFEHSRLIVFHNTYHRPNREVFRLQDFTEPGFHPNYLARSFQLSLNSNSLELNVSAWKEGGSQWTGEIELIKIDTALHTELIPESNTMAVVYKAGFNKVVQLQKSTDLIVWDNVGEPIVGDDNYWLELIPTASQNSQFVRTKHWVISTDPD